MARPRSAETQARLVLKARMKRQYFDTARVRKQLARANYEALRKAGLDVKEAAKRGIGQVAPARTKAGRKAVKAGAIVEFVGGLYQDLTMMGSGKPRPAGKPIKSWAPKRFAYRDIRDIWDDGRKSIVIGAENAHWLARLHEFGGSLVLRAYRIGVGAARNAYLRRRGFRGQGRDERGRFTTRVRQSNQYEYGALIWSNKPLKSRRNWEATSITKTARYPARPYMQGAAGVQKVVARIRERFRNTLRKAG
jgi:phage gpG-like protein